MNFSALLETTILIWLMTSYCVLVAPSTAELLPHDYYNLIMAHFAAMVSCSNTLIRHLAWHSAIYQHTMMALDLGIRGEVLWEPTWVIEIHF